MPQNFIEVPVELHSDKPLKTYEETMAYTQIFMNNVRRAGSFRPKQSLENLGSSSKHKVKILKQSLDGILVTGDY